MAWDCRSWTCRSPGGGIRSAAREKRSVACEDRAAERIVQPGLYRVDAQVLIEQERRPACGEDGVAEHIAEVVVQIFDLGAPVRRKLVFGAGADGVSGIGRVPGQRREGTGDGAEAR